MKRVEENYQMAKELYAQMGVDTDQVLRTLSEVPISVHCWQIDDLTGFENPNAVLSGGIAAIGNAPGKPKSKEEFIKQLDQALDLIPGNTKLALHAVYLDNQGKKVDRNEILPEHFAGWVDYAKKRGIGLDFNPTYFSHPMSDSGFTLASSEEGVRSFWIEHGKRCRKIGEYFGRELGQVCITNHWIGDGYKDHTIDKVAPRMRLKDSLDQIFAESIDWRYNIDSVESKLFGLGSEAYVPGSHEFYTNYVMTQKNCILCMDAGHFHPTETVSAKISSYLVFGQELMLHVSRPVRWDSDHVVMLDDETKAIMQEIVRYQALDKVHIGLDFFDASINRVAATVIGARNARKALLYALLEPSEELIRVEQEGNLTRRLALSEEMKTMPAGLVWDMFCEREGVPGVQWLDITN
ncbi:L-rhamnose isomerase [Diplocloster hominis]|uniref:L-rhamnose isomerase n=1 Tax=Diplocloster hominis TaxID=3079010 RepID=UPI0031BABD63